MGLIKPQCLETKLTYHLIKMPQTFWIFFERNQLTKNTFISGEFQKKKKKAKDARGHNLSHTSTNKMFC